MDLSDDFILGQYHLTTPDIKRLSKQLRFWVFAAIRGGMIIGEKRVGKTYAIDWIRLNIDKLLGRPCYSFDIRWKKVERLHEKYFWNKLLGATGFDTTLPGDAQRIEARLYERIALQVQEAGVPVCLLFIDEAQNINLAEFDLLCHFFNELENRGIRLYTWLFGQVELLDARTLMRESHNEQVLARLMQHSFEMQGISSARILKALLNQLDRSGVPERASAKAVEGGFKLSALAADLWKAMQAVRKKLGLPVQAPWTMQQFQSVSAVVLLNVAHGRKTSVDPTQTDLEKCIEIVLTNETYSDNDDEDEDDLK